MAIYPFKLIPLVIILAIWIILMIWFGFDSHFSLAGACLCIQVMSWYGYDHVQTFKVQLVKRIASVVGMLVSIVSIINAFYLESSSIALQLLVIVFGLACVYIFSVMIRDSQK